MTTRSTRLDPQHYAYDWIIPVSKEQFYSLEEINKVGYDYGMARDGAKKEAMLLCLTRYFHGYLMKYVDMILRGHVPSYKNRINRDAQAFLRFFLPRGTELTQQALSRACHSLHLGFKKQEASEVYDSLMLILLRAIRKYDPLYVKKLERVVKVIHGPLRQRKQFTESDIRKRLGFVCTGFIRVLVRRGFLASVRGPGKKLLGYRKQPAWPPPSDLFQQGPIGFTYFIQIWFRYYLQEHIDRQMGQLETLEHVLQLEHRTGIGVDADSPETQDYLPHSEGGLVDAKGQRWDADTTLMNRSLDLPQMTLHWVQDTQDPLFKRLNREERLLLYLHYVEEKPYREIGKSLHMTPAKVKELHEQILVFLQDRVNYRPGKKDEPALDS